LPRRDGALRATGALLTASGVASWVGIIGIASASDVLSFGSILGGVLFLGALVGMSFVWLRAGRETG